MRIYLPTVGIQPEISAVRDFESLARESASSRHQLVSDPRAADILLFTECHQLNDPIFLGRIWQSAEYRRDRSKCYVFDQRPRAYCSMPGLYTSVPWRSFRPTYQVPWSYHTIGAIPYSADTEPDLLFSFVGTTRSHPCRRDLMQLSHDRALMKQVDGHVNWNTSDQGYQERRDFFFESLQRSAFVLCPRGRATSSFRFYEAMAAGRVPVVLADDWIPPRGIDVSQFAIRWPERGLDSLVAYLERHEEESREMGRLARAVYEERFARNVMFDNIGDALELLAASRPWDTFPRFGYLPDHRVARHIAGRTRKLVSQARAKAAQRRA